MKLWIDGVRPAPEGYVRCKSVNEAIYNIFVYAEDKRINCVQYSGDDNGYYGTGYYLYVKIPNLDGGNK